MVASTWRAVCSGMSKSCGSTALPSSPGCRLRAVRGFAFILIFWFRFCASGLGYKLSYKPIFCEETATKAFQPESGNFSSATTSSRRVTKPVKPLKWKTKLRCTIHSVRRCFVYWTGPCPSKRQCNLNCNRFENLLLWFMIPSFIQPVPLGRHWGEVFGGFDLAHLTQTRPEEEVLSAAEKRWQAWRALSLLLFCMFLVRFLGCFSVPEI